MKFLHWLVSPRGAKTFGYVLMILGLINQNWSQVGIGVALYIFARIERLEDEIDKLKDG